jgi:hypothetical protein
MQRKLQDYENIHVRLSGLGDTLQALFARPAGRQVGAKPVPQSTQLIRLDVGVFLDYTLQHNPLLHTLLKTEPGFATDKDVLIDNKGYSAMMSAFEDVVLTHDLQRYDYDHKTWDIKEFDVLTNVVNLIEL